MKNALQRSFKKKTKGSILVLTLVTVNCLLLLSLYLIKKIEMINFYNSNNTSVELKENDFQKQKEFVLSRFNNYLLANITIINEKGVETYFREFNNNPIVSYERASIKFDKVNKQFFIEVLVDRSTINYSFKLEIEENKIVIINNKFKYTFLS